MRNCICVFLACLVFALTATADAGLRLANIFNDHMVLQQEKPLKIWGWATPGTEVTVTLTESAQQAVAAVGEETLKRAQPAAQTDEDPKPIVRIEYVHENAPEFTAVNRQAKADAAGRWSVALDPLAASFRPKFPCAVAGNEKTAVIDVLVGESWVTAGQSNMAFSGDKTGWLNKEGLLLPGLRYAHTGRSSSYKPAADLPERAVEQLDKK